jgi:signal transduction histidine kinase
MKHICQILLLLLPVCGFSQQRTIDSLQRLLPTATTDSAQFALSIFISNNYQFINYDSALFYADKSLLIAQRNRKELNVGNALSTKGYILSNLQRHTEAFQALTAGLQIAEDSRSKNDFWNLSYPRVKDKDYRLLMLAQMHNQLGIFMFHVDKIDQTVYHYNESIKLLRAIGDSLGMAIAISNLGEMYWKSLNQPDSALLLEQAAESLLVKKKAESSLGVVYFIMGASYLIKQNDSIGLAYLYKAIPINKKYDAQAILAAVYRVLADFYVQKNNKDSSLYYAGMAARIHMPEYPMDLGDDFEILAKSYELNNKPDSANKYHRIALATYDSLYKNRIKGLTGFQQLSFDQQQQLQQLEAEKTAAQNRTRMYTLFAGLGLAILVSVFLYRNSRQQKKANLLMQQQKNETEEQKLKAESALQRLQATQQQLIQSEKMASLGELTAGIAHEIQNPLNFVNNFSDVNTELIEEAEQELDKGNVGEAKLVLADLHENEQKINHHGKRADAIVKGMLEHSRTSKGEKHPTDINGLADEYLRLSYHGLRAKDKEFNVDFKTDFDESIGRIEVVPQDIGRVLLNLFNNAFYATNEKKQQLNGTFKPLVTVTTKRTRDKVEIVVKDNGSGMRKSVVDKIFQPFFTTKPTGQGTGLGLSLSYDVIKAHGGEIKVESKEGEGSTFIIQL